MREGGDRAVKEGSERARERKRERESAIEITGCPDESDHLCTSERFLVHQKRQSERGRGRDEEWKQACRNGDKQHQRERERERTSVSRPHMRGVMTLHFPLASTPLTRLNIEQRRREGERETDQKSE